MHNYGERGNCKTPVITFFNDYLQLLVTITLEAHLWIQLSRNTKLDLLL